MYEAIEIILLEYQAIFSCLHNLAKSSSADHRLDG